MKIVPGHTRLYRRGAVYYHRCAVPTDSKAGVKISMDGRGRCMDNIFIERLWRSLKYEAVYLHEMADGFTAQKVIGEWLSFYNKERPLSALDDRTPGEAYWSDRQEKMAA